MGTHRRRTGHGDRVENPRINRATATTPTFEARRLLRNRRAARIIRGLGVALNETGDVAMADQNEPVSMIVVGRDETSTVINQSPIRPRDVEAYKAAVIRTALIRSRENVKADILGVRTFLDGAYPELGIEFGLPGFEEERKALTDTASEHLDPSAIWRPRLPYVNIGWVNYNDMSARELEAIRATLDTEFRQKIRKEEELDDGIRIAPSQMFLKTYIDFQSRGGVSIPRKQGPPGRISR